MTREEAIKTWLPIISMGINSMPELKEAFDMAVKALEQESVIDKIRAEIIERDRNVKAVRNDSCCFFTAEEVLEIVDKCKGESEG